MPLFEPARHTRTAKRAERLDPVRWRGPRRGTLLRLTAVAVLLLTSAVLLWSRPPDCAPVGAIPSATPPRPSPVPGRPAESPAIPSGSVGVPVRLADPTALTVVHPGHRVDLLRVDDRNGRTTPVASAALVVEVTGAEDPATGGLLLALGPAEAERAVAASGHGFAILIRPD